MKISWRYAAALVLGLGFHACARPPAEPVTLTIFDLGPYADAGFTNWRREALERFQRDTGTTVTVMPIPESANLQLTSMQKRLESGAATPDVCGMDVIWPPILARHLVDLNPFLARDAAAQFPALVASNTVDGRLVAMPYHANGALLFYRTDLLERYGFAAPPTTWDELEQMASAIQTGERARGHNPFWGYVWQGALDEALMCNALEWQASSGGGAIVENGAVTVDNPATVRAWRRASRWVGSISPPDVLAHIETDTLRTWAAGEAAFMRNWAPAYHASRSAGSSVRGRFAVTALPTGGAGHVTSLGGYGWGVSRYSRHQPQAVALVRYLCSREVQQWRARSTSMPPTMPELYADAEALKVNPFLAQLKQAFLAGVVVRPSAVVGARYIDVSEAYCRAVHSVLTDRKEASEASADLAQELSRITGLPVRHPPAR